MEKDYKIDLHALIEKASESDLATIENVVTQLVHVINDPKSSVRDLKDIIEVDPPLSARVLKVANSAYYASPRPIDEIQQAIIWLGFETLKEIALNQKICEMFDSKGQNYDFSRLELWKHSIAVALFGKFLYRREFGERGENIYAAGLLHDIGIIIEDQFIHESFLDMLKERKEKGYNLHDIEKRNLGYEHGQVGEEISRRWTFPDELSAAIGAHHDTNKLGGPHNRLARALFISDFVCQKNEIGYCDSPQLDEKDFYHVVDSLQIKPKALDFIFDEVLDNLRIMEEEGWFSK